MHYLTFTGLNYMLVSRSLCYLRTTFKKEISMPKAYTWSKLLDDLYRMKIESDKESLEKPLLGPFIKCVQEQQLSLAVTGKKPTNFELVFGYCVANLSIIRARQIQHEEAKNLQKADSLNQPLVDSLNLVFDTLEHLAREELQNLPEQL